MVLLLAGATLTGYVLHDADLIEVRSGLRGMSPPTAAGLLVLALSFLAEASNKRRAARSLAWAGLFIGSVMLMLRVVQGRDTISPLVAAQLFGFDPSRAGRTALATSGSFVILAISGILRARTLISDALAASSLIVSALALLGYAYGVEDLYRLRPFDTMALHTAGALFLLSVTALILPPGRGWSAIILSRGPGGGATRRQLAFLILPPVTGWVLLRAMDVHGIGPAAAMAFQVVVTVVPLAILILRDGRALDALEAERRAKVAIQAELQKDLGIRLSEQAVELEQQSVERSKAEAALSRVQRMDAIGQLTGGIAHDFNNLLMAIGGNLDLLSRKLPGDHPLHRYVTAASAATDRGQKLTGQLLAFSRIQQLDLRSIEVDAVLVAARDLIGNAMGPGISVDMRLGARRAWVMADPDQLELAVLNLALNARDAMPGGGQLTIESAPYRSHPQDQDDEASYVAVRVIDTGHGMSPDVTARAVEPFFTTKERGKGTGLGLAQVYGFVRQCGGDLRITSALDEGATIELLLPCAGEPSRDQDGDPAERSVAAIGGDRRPVLVIDDDDDVRAVVTDALRAAGYDVHEADDGDSALVMLETIAPAVAIIDFIMPGLNGAEVARRARVLRPGLPVVFVSGYHETVALRDVEGAVLLRKPFSLDNLRRAVSAVLH